MWSLPIPRKPSDRDVLTWVIGSGGLIGSAIHHAAGSVFDASPVPWDDSDRSRQVLGTDLDRFIEQAQDRTWAIVWAAGAGTTTTPRAAFVDEIGLNTWFWQQVGQRHPRGPGAVMLVSSAGSIHAGSIRPPFTHATEPAPISDYGRAKLSQESAGRDALIGKIPFVVCRVSNAYGPGQNLKKLQGLVSRLALATYTHTPLHLFVPLSTVRDYIFTPDVAERVLAWARYAVQSQDLQPQTTVVASGVGTSIAQLVRVAGQVSHQRIPVTMGTHASSALQPHDSRFIPTPIPGDRPPSITSLPVGVRAVFDDIQQRIASAQAVG